MFYKKMALGLLAAVTFAAPAMAQSEQGQASIQRVNSQSVAVDGSTAISNIHLNSQQTQSGENGFFGSQGQTSVQEVDSQNVAIGGSEAITNINLNSRQEQWLSPNFYDYGSQGQVSIQDVDSQNTAIGGSTSIADFDLDSQQYLYGY